MLIQAAVPAPGGEPEYVVVQDTEGGDPSVQRRGRRSLPMSTLTLTWSARTQVQEPRDGRFALHSRKFSNSREKVPSGF